LLWDELRCLFIHENSKSGHQRLVDLVGIELSHVPYSHSPVANYLRHWELQVGSEDYISIRLGYNLAQVGLIKVLGVNEVSVLAEVGGALVHLVACFNTCFL